MSELDSSEIQDIEIDGFLKKQRSNVSPVPVTYNCIYARLALSLTRARSVALYKLSSS